MRRAQSTTTLFTFLLIGVFTLLCLLVVVLGGRVYARIAENAERNTALRTSLCYVASKVRAGDRAGGVETQSVDGRSLLALREEHGGVDYTTYIYCENGGLCEYFTRSDRAFAAELGERIAAAEDFACTVSPEGLLCVRLTQSAQTYTLHMQLRGGYS